MKCIQAWAVSQKNGGLHAERRNFESPMDIVAMRSPRCIANRYSQNQVNYVAIQGY